MIGRRADRLARRLYRRFRNLPGAEHIATETAIAGLIRSLRWRRPKRVLEIGAGIGTLTAALIETLDSIHRPGGFLLVAVEPDAFCRRALATNLGRDLERVRLIHSLAELGSDQRFDFLIVDGGGREDESVFGRLAAGAAVFIEGDRAPQAAALERAAASRRLARADVRTLRRRTLEGGHRVYDGGYRLYRLDADLGSRLRLAFLDLRTKVVYRIRRLRR